MENVNHEETARPNLRTLSVDVPRYLSRQGSACANQDRGYLPDPETTLGKALAPSVLPFVDAFSSRCVVILGDPGIGKSEAFGRRMADLQSQADTACYDLRWCRTDDVLTDPALRAWQRGERELHLLVDSIDEAGDPRFPNLLVGALKRGSPSRLRLELACRGSEWPAVLENELQKLFGVKEYSVFVMEPLRHRDVVDFTLAANVDPTRFIRAVAEHDLQLLAARPMTLLMLLDVFASEEELPAQATDLYEKACLLLCDERSASRLAAGATPLLEPEERLRIAEWLAAASVLCRRPVVASAGTHPAENEISEDLVASMVPSATRRDVGDALKSGLFTSVGPDRHGWIHHSLAEYLAAKWMVRFLAHAQRQQLLVHPASRDAIPPQLWGLASWLCCISADTAGWVARTMPELLLACSSGPVIGDQDRRDALEKYLERVRSREALTWWWQPHQLRRFDHAGLCDQLAAVFENSDEDVLLRRIAMDIAEAASVGELAEKIAAVATDRSISSHVREAAVSAAWALSADKAALAPLIRELAGHDDADPHERVRAAAIESLWPDYLTADELFRLLTTPRRPNFSGSYQQLFWQLPLSFGRDDLLVGLRWARTRPESRAHRDNLPIERLIHAVCHRAYDLVDDEDVLQELGVTAGVLLMSHRPVFDAVHRDEVTELLANATKRRKLVRAIVLNSQEWDGAFRLVHPHGQERLVSAEDMTWILEQWRASANQVRSRWADVVRDVLRFAPDTDSMGLVLDEVGDAQHSDLLSFPRYIVLGSKEADDTRAAHDKQLELERKWAEQRREERPPPDPIAAADETLAGKTDVWWRVVCELRHRADYKLRCAPLDFLGWQERTEAERATLTDAAKAYLLHASPEPEHWLHEVSVRFYPADAGLVTLLLLHEVDGEWVCAHETALAARWAAAIVGFDVHELWVEPQRESFARLLAWCTNASPRHVADALRTVVSREKARHNADLRVLSHLSPSPDVVGVLHTHISDGWCSLTAFQQLIAAILRLDLDVGLELARERLRLPGAAQRRHRGRQRARLAFRRSLGRDAHVCDALARCGARGWTMLWAACRFRPWLADVVTRTALTTDSAETALTDLDTTLIAEIYGWLARHRPLPPGTDDGWDREQERAFRQQLLNALVERATHESVAELALLRQRYPADESVRFRLPDAVRRYQEASWSPVSFEDLARLAEAASRRVVRSNDQLLDAIMDAITEYERRLHAETPAVVDLWNYDVAQGGRKTYNPKDENDFSDHLKRELKRTLNGVIVNREVEIRPTEAKREGQRVDLLVEAIDLRDGAGLAVIIEVKGSWHRDLETSLTDQLVGRYLSRGTLTHGIYLVGWFNRADWDAADWRRDACRRRDRDAIEAALRSQAIEASDGVRRIEVVLVDAAI